LKNLKLITESDAKDIFCIEELLGDVTLSRGIDIEQDSCQMPPLKPLKKKVSKRSKKTSDLLHKIKFDKKVGKKSNLDSDKASESLMDGPGALKRFG